MLPPKLTLARSRLLTPIFATFLLLGSRIFLPISVASAAEVSAPIELPALGQPALHAAPDAPANIRDDDRDNDASGGYAPEFGYFDRSLLGRQEPQVSELKNNERTEMDIAQGATAYFVLKRGQSRVVRADEDALGALEARAAVNMSRDRSDEGVIASDNVDESDVSEELRKRQTGNRVWISASTCRQPGFTEGQTPKNHPQLVMYVSTSSRNQKPGPDSTEGLATPPAGVLFDNGFASFDLNTTSPDVYIGIGAPNLEDGWFGSWHFEIAASLEGSYYNYTNSTPFLYLIDRDSDSALFITYNLSEPNTTNTTEKWIDNNPFRMYAWPVGDNTNITGMEHSLCALKSLNNQTDVTVLTTITTKFGGSLPKSQFHVQGLKNGTKYNGFLTVEGSQDVLQLPGAGTVRGGGKVFQQFEFMTKFGI
jgi:calcium channel MID1